MKVNDLTSDGTAQFKLVEIAPFDARSGCRRCQLPGVAVSAPGPCSRATADFWRDRRGRVLVRWSSLGYSYSFEAVLGSGEDIPDEAMEALGDFVANLLWDWVNEGVDELPNALFNYP